MKVLVIGSGGRESALAWKLSESPKVKTVYFAKGTEGAEDQGKIVYLNQYADTDYKELCKFALKEKIDLTVVGPDQALADGLVDLFESKKLKVFGPSQKAAMAESSKDFAKSIMSKGNIPTARYRTFTDSEEAYAFIEDATWAGYVVKKDGLALGKGVVVCKSKEEAQSVVEDYLADDDCEKVIVEEKLVGREVSYFCLCDGRSFYTLGHACDYKRIRDNDEGPNTGGMGTYAPADWLSTLAEQEIEQRVILPFLNEMEKMGAVFKGALFVGIIITKAGPQVLEFNVRFGDPETQVLLPLLDEDLFDVLYSCAIGKAEKRKCKLKAMSGVHLVSAAYGYPGTEGISVRKGDIISIDKEQLKETHLFYAGVKFSRNKLLTNGGRVLGITSLGKTREEAREKVYKAQNAIKFEGLQFRSDIGV